MSGARLCTLLGELGYEGTKSGSDSLDPDSFEWPFQYEDTRPILHWICSTLRPSNILSVSELSQYEQFKLQGKLLEGDDLDFAFDSISAFSDTTDNQEALFGPHEPLNLKDIKEATLAYKTEAADLQRQLRHLQSQFDMLSSQASTLTQGRRARVGATSVVNGHLTTIDDSLSGRNLQMNAVLGRIASTSEELAHYHSGDEDGIYLAYSDFSQFLLGDSSCLKELNQWFAKQLDTGPFRLVAEEGKSKCSWVNLDDVSSNYVRDLEKSHHQRLSELQRLRSMYVLLSHIIADSLLNTQAALLTYVSAPGIVQQISGLHSDLMTLQSDLDNSLPEERNRCINELCNLIQSMQQLLFASSTTAQPILTPRPLMKELDEMEKINAKLSAAVEEVTLEHVKKNEIVKHHSQEIGLQRRVFVDFFCNPERLRSQVRELTARVRALQIS
ncbi:AUGMIN subunit [Trifolium repens]|nr:AUGMIN subunit [Trifolium repens]